MILFVVICSLLIIGLLEALSRRDDVRRLHITCEPDMDLVAPDEILTLRYSVTNTSRFPVLYVSFGLQLSDAAQVREDAEWTRRHVYKDFVGTRVDHRFYLLPGHRFTGRVRLSFRKRGAFDLGTCYVETGDLLGLWPVVRSQDLRKRIICTARTCPAEDIRTVGGLLGDLSVRRFLHEDPTMVIGYHDYTGREPMKQISWTRTAASGRLTVRTWDHTVDRNVTVLVNMEATYPRISEQCLMLTRSVCEELEHQKIPYAVRSNGDLQSLREGLGRPHLFYILRKIGLSRLTGYRGFPSLVEECARYRRGGESYIVITPALSEAGQAALSRLQALSDLPLCMLYGEEKRA